MIFERKTWQDLAASIIDGRSKDQKSRMFAYVDECKTQHNQSEGGVSCGDETPKPFSAHIVYLIEGPIPTWNSKPSHTNIPHARLYQHLALSQARDNIIVAMLPDQESISKYVIYFAAKACNGDLATADAGAPATTSNRAFSSNKRKNDKAMGPWYNMLASLPGIGAKKAKVISDTYPNASSLMKTFESTESSVLKKRIKPLADLVSGNRRVGDASAKTIYSALCGE